MSITKRVTIFSLLLILIINTDLVICDDTNDQKGPGGEGESDIEGSDDFDDASVDKIATYCADNGCTDSDLTNIPADKRADFLAVKTNSVL